MPNTNKPSVEQENAARDEYVKKTAKWYTSVAYLQGTYDFPDFDKMYDKGNIEGILIMAQEYDQGDGLDLEYTDKRMTHYRGDEVVAQNDNIAVVMNNTVGGTLEILRVCSEDDVRLQLEHDGYEERDLPERATDDIKELAGRMRQEEKEQSLNNEKKYVALLSSDFHQAYPFGYRFQPGESISFHNEATNKPDEIIGIDIKNGRLQLRLASNPDNKDGLDVKSLNKYDWQAIGDNLLMLSSKDSKETVEALLRNDYNRLWPTNFNKLGESSLRTLYDEMEKRIEKTKKDIDNERIPQVKKSMMITQAYRAHNFHKVMETLHIRLHPVFSRLGEMQSNCRNYLSRPYADESVLFTGSVDKEIEAMRSLYKKIPDSMKPVWLQKDMIDNYDKYMHALKFVDENRNLSLEEQIKEYSKLQGVDETAASRIVKNVVGGMMFNERNYTKIGAKLYNDEVRGDKNLLFKAAPTNDIITSEVSEGYFFLKLSDKQSSAKDARKEDIVISYSPQGVKHQQLTKEDVAKVNSLGGTIITVDRDEFQRMTEDTRNTISQVLSRAKDGPYLLQSQKHISSYGLSSNLKYLRTGGLSGHKPTGYLKTKTEQAVIRNLVMLQSVYEKTFLQEAKALEGKVICKNFGTDFQQNINLGKLKSSGTGSNKEYYFDTIDGKYLAAALVDMDREGKLMKRESIQLKAEPDKEQGKKYTPEEYSADRFLSDGREVDKLIVYKEHDEKRPDYGKFRIYTQVGEQKMSRTMSEQDLKAYFDRTTTPSKLVEKNFGEQLHLASFYNQFKFPVDSDVKQVLLSKSVNGQWYVQADLGEKGLTTKHVLTWNDKQALFSMKSATKEQLAARYLSDEISVMNKLGVTMNRVNWSLPNPFKDLDNNELNDHYHELYDAYYYLRQRDIQSWEPEKSGHSNKETEIAEEKWVKAMEEMKSRGLESKLGLEAMPFKAMPNNETLDVPQSYDVFAMKNGNRNLIKTGLSSLQATRFIERNDARFQRKGFDYLITLPQETIQRKAIPNLDLTNARKEFIQDMTPMQQARANKVLDTLVRYEDGIMTRGEYAKYSVEHGKVLSYMSNDRGKIEYGFRLPESSSYTPVTKTEAEFALKLGMGVDRLWNKEYALIESKMAKIENKYKDSGMFHTVGEPQKTIDFYEGHIAKGHHLDKKMMERLDDLRQYRDLKEQWSSMPNPRIKQEKRPVAQTLKDAGVEKIQVFKNFNGQLMISATGKFGSSLTKPLSAKDSYDLVHSKTVTKEQVLVKYFPEGFKASDEKNISRSNGRKR